LLFPHIPLLALLINIIIYSWSSFLALNKRILQDGPQDVLRVMVFRGYILFENNNFEVSGVQSVPSSKLLGCFSSAQSQSRAPQVSIFVNKQI